MKNKFLFILLLLPFCCLQAQKNLGKTKGELLLEKSDCTIEFANAFMLTTLCGGRYEEFQFNGGLIDSKNNVCSQESIEVDSIAIPKFKKSIVESVPAAKFSNGAKEKPARLKSPNGEKMPVMTEFVEAGEIIVWIMHGDAHGNTGEGIYTLVFNKIPK